MKTAVVIAATTAAVAAKIFQSNLLINKLELSIEIAEYRPNAQRHIDSLNFKHWCCLLDFIFFFFFTFSSSSYSLLFFFFFFAVSFSTATFCFCLALRTRPQHRMVKTAKYIIFFFSLLEINIYFENFSNAY